MRGGWWDATNRRRRRRRRRGNSDASVAQAQGLTHAEDDG